MEKPTHKETEENVAEAEVSLGENLLYVAKSKSFAVEFEDNILIDSLYLIEKGFKNILINKRKKI